MTTRALPAAIEAGDVERVAALLGDAPAPSLPDGQTCAMLAARFARGAMLRGFLARGDDVNAETRTGQTALMFAAGRGAAGCVTVLLRAGADPGATNAAGFDASAVALQNGHMELAARLAAAQPLQGPGWLARGPVAATLALRARAAKVGHAGLRHEADVLAALLQPDVRWTLATTLIARGETDDAFVILAGVGKWYAQNDRPAEGARVFAQLADLAPPLRSDGLLESAVRLARRVPERDGVVETRLARRYLERGDLLAAWTLLDELQAIHLEKDTGLRTSLQLALHPAGALPVAPPFASPLRYTARQAQALFATRAPAVLGLPPDASATAIADAIDAAFTARRLTANTESQVAPFLSIALCREGPFDPVTVYSAEGRHLPGIRARHGGRTGGAEHGVWPLYETLLRMRRQGLPATVGDTVRALLAGTFPLLVAGSPPPPLAPAALDTEQPFHTVDPARLAAVRDLPPGTWVDLDRFFLGNDAPASFGYNLTPVAVRPQICYRYLLAIRALPTVHDVRVRILDQAGPWPSADTVELTTSAPISTVRFWFPEELRPDEVVEGEERAEGSRVLVLRWG